jgi:hypothetical protein
MKSAGGTATLFSLCAGPDVAEREADRDYALPREAVGLFAVLLLYRGPSKKSRECMI